MGRRKLISIISIVFSITMGLLVILGALVMMYGNFDLGLILFVLGLVLVISNEGILPKLRKKKMKEHLHYTSEEGLIEEIANLAAIGYTPPILLGVYLYLSGDHDFKLIVFMGLTFVVVTMKIFAKVAASRFNYRPIEGEEVYSYKPGEEEEHEPGV
ncbi:MAG: hypothetical protein ABIH83_04035 [Candidatus Micrarchaeota archaeon]